MKIENKTTSPNAIKPGSCYEDIFSGVVYMVLGEVMEEPRGALFSLIVLNRRYYNDESAVNGSILRFHRVHIQNPEYTRCLS